MYVCPVQGRHALFFIAASVGMACLEMQAWARWLTDSDAKGYMKNDEAFLARLSRKQVGGLFCSLLITLLCLT